MVSLYYVIQEMLSFSMRPAKYFYDKPLPKYLDLKTVLIYRPHPVDANCSIGQKKAISHSLAIIRDTRFRLTVQYKKNHGQNLSSTSGEAEPSAQYFFQNWSKAEAPTLEKGLPEMQGGGGLMRPEMNFLMVLLFPIFPSV